MQLYFDLGKLWRKGVVLSTAASPGHVAGPAVAWIAIIGATLLLPAGPAGAPWEEPFRDMKLLFYIAAATRSPGFSGTPEGSATASPSASPSTTWISVTLEAPFFTGRRATV